MGRVQGKDETDIFSTEYPFILNSYESWNYFTY